MACVKKYAILKNWMFLCVGKMKSYLLESKTFIDKIGQENFICKGLVVNILSFVIHMVSVAATELLPHM